MSGVATRRSLLAVLATAVGVLTLAVALAVTAPAASAQSDEATTTTAEPDTQLPTGNILPRPNSGQAPDSPNDPGGWQQYLVFGLIFAGLAVIVVLVTRESRKARGSRPS